MKGKKHKPQNHNKADKNYPMCELIDKYFIAIAGTILTLSFGGYITWRIYSKNRFISASEKFRSVILRELAGLYPIQSNWPDTSHHLDKLLTDKFPVLQSAVTEFRGYLPWYKLKSFDRAWYRYYNAYADEPAYENPGNSKQAYHHYMDFGNYPNHKETFQQNVTALLKFAKTK